MMQATENGWNMAETDLAGVIGFVRPRAAERRCKNRSDTPQQDVQVWMELYARSEDEAAALGARVRELEERLARQEEEHSCDPDLEAKIRAEATRKAEVWIELLAQAEVEKEAAIERQRALEVEVAQLRQLLVSREATLTALESELGAQDGGEVLQIERWTAPVSMAF